MVAQYFDSSEYSSRLRRAAVRSSELGIDALVIGPGPDLRYLTGYHAHLTERFVGLILPVEEAPFVVVPTLEKGTALASPISGLGLEVVTWEETEDPYTLIGDRLSGVDLFAVDERMWAIKAHALARALPRAEEITAEGVLSYLRMRKTDAEITELMRAGEAIDNVHAAVPALLRPGRTEREIAKDIADLILDSHDTADFVIVAGGANSASPHHLPSDYVLAPGDVVVVDIGGTIASGYCSDSTRTYSLGAPDPEFLQAYAVLQQAQQETRDAAVVGMPCEDLDRTARDLLADAGLDQYFIHRLGHGIGLETHENPYMVKGNQEPLAAGMAFSVEPGFYIEGKWGARIEDIVVCTKDGPLACNTRPHDLLIVE